MEGCVTKQWTYERKAKSLHWSLSKYGIDVSVERLIKWMKATPQCEYCGLAISIEDYSADHIIPRSKGGADSIKNIHLIDKGCNQMKGNLTDEEFKVLMKFLLAHPSIYHNVRTRLKMAGFAFHRSVPSNEDLRLMAWAIGYHIKRIQLRLYAADTLADIIYWDSAWFVVFVLVGLSWNQIAWSLVLGTATAIPLARPYGKFMDWMRRRFGV